MRSPEFLRDANAAVAKAVANLQAKSIEPAYVARRNSESASPQGRAAIESLTFAVGVQTSVADAIADFEAKKLKPGWDND
ncbi:hypothetical protein PWP93_13115 [Paraburkholderia sp. A1RI-2L]|uniref:hypothetical protein n=1 Tax=Paraburkholderia sp. A1RI-2L TaxID=3028367 RepID=UPI003B766DDD